MTGEQKIAIWNWLEKKKYQTDYEATGEYKMYYDLDMPKIITDYISEHSALKEQWISVDERLPKFPDNKTNYFSDRVLALGDGDYCIVGVLYKQWNGKITCYQLNGSCIHDVTHWQPLPTPPVKK